MKKLKSLLTTAVLAVLAALAVVGGIFLTILFGVLHAVMRALPYILVIGFVLWCVTGCVYQPIDVNVYVPTTALVGGDVVLDAHKTIQAVTK